VTEEEIRKAERVIAIAPDLTPLEYAVASVILDQFGGPMLAEANGWRARLLIEKLRVKGYAITPL
jgi:hypothetical protein